MVAEQPEMLTPDEESSEESSNEQQPQEQQPQEQQPQDDTSAAWDVVQPGDSWASLAERNGTSVEALYALNSDAPHFSERSVTVNGIVRVR